MPKDINNGKPKLSLLPRDSLELIARVFEEGNDEHKKNDWKGTIPLSVHQDAALRHLFAVNDGEFIDPDSKRKALHWAKVACNCFILIHNYLNYPHLNDITNDTAISN